MTIGSSAVLRQCPGVTYRQLDYWCRTGILRPEVEARGSGRPRRWGSEQVRVVRLVANLAALGAESDALREAAEQASALPDHWWTGPVVVSAEGDLSGEGRVKSAGYLVDLAACTSDARELLSA